MTDRLFFALWPGEMQRAALAKVQMGLRSHRGRLAHAQDLHITLVFLGDLDVDRRACAEQAAGRVRAAPFSLTLDRVGCFPRARILWCGVSERPQPLLSLLCSLNGELLDCGFRPERRPFAPHVTLVRKARPLSARELTPPIAWSVSAFVLVIARPGERPRYRVVREWPLAS
jgi:RNA 2',3'-cyclic 3'-phosphodiesterase